MDKMLHPRSDVDRLYVQRKEGGRGLTQLEASFETSMVGLDCYISLKQETKLNLVKSHDSYKAKYSITKTATKVKQEYDLADEVCREDRTPSENAKALKTKLKEKFHQRWKEQWEGKPLHGQYPINVQKPYVDQAATNLWLTTGDLKGLAAAEYLKLYLVDLGLGIEL
ncbi:hypothetical protein AC249_AIPGENE12518 [Exaiptasia diaphana]|nr:hypothetical protein AC249_AIPGENE12518 [Exaiptasia diaphana]